MRAVRQGKADRRIRKGGAVEGRLHCRSCKKPRTASKEAGSALDPAKPTFGVGLALGFSAQRDGLDLIIEQKNADTIQTIWLSRHEAADLVAYINSQMDEWSKESMKSTVIRIRMQGET